MLNAGEVLYDAPRAGVPGAVLHCERGVPGDPGDPDPLRAPVALSTGLMSGGSLMSPPVNISTLTLFCAEAMFSLKSHLFE
jgi:hypothetical protein